MTTQQAFAMIWPLFVCLLCGGIALYVTRRQKPVRVVQATEARRTKDQPLSAAEMHEILETVDRQIKVAQSRIPLAPQKAL
jgi:hypothetical protein